MSYSGQKFLQQPKYTSPNNSCKSSDGENIFLDSTIHKAAERIQNNRSDLQAMIIYDRHLLYLNQTCVMTRKSIQTVTKNAYRTEQLVDK